MSLERYFEEMYIENNLRPLFKRLLNEADESIDANNQKSELSRVRKIARDALSSNIIENKIIPFTRKNYNEQLTEQPIETPVEKITMGKTIYKGGDLFDKMRAHTNRQNDIFKIKTTLEQPSIIIKSPRYRNGYIYAKTYDDSKLGGKVRQIFSVIIDNQKVISSYNEDHARIRDFVDDNITSSESLIWYEQITPATLGE